MPLTRLQDVRTAAALVALMLALALVGVTHAHATHPSATPSAPPGQPLALQARRFMPSESASTFDTELDNAYVNTTLQLESGTRTALVLIDVWDDAKDAVLAENERLRMLPLVALARKTGWLVIHAPSEGKEWGPIADVLPGEILVTGDNGTTDRCDVHITSSPRNITHVVVAGYDTNMCVIDKPCGTVATSSGVTGQGVQVILARDATRSQSVWYHNYYFSTAAATNMLETAPWLTGGGSAPGGVPSTTVADLAHAFGIADDDPIMVNATTPLTQLPPSTAQTYKSPAPVPASGSDLRNGTTALVLVSCTDDWHNDGFRGRVLANRHAVLEPLVRAARAATSFHVIHAPNGHVEDGACAPLGGEFVANTTADFDAYVSDHGITTLLYAGYSANVDMMWGVGGMARYYSLKRYFAQNVPQYYWVGDATIGRETGELLAGGEWAKQMALAYRQPLVTPNGNVLASADVIAALAQSRQPHQHHATTASDADVTPRASSGLDAAELAVLRTLYTNCGGDKWQYAAGTDAVSRGQPWFPFDRAAADPCAGGWFGVKCDATGTHVVQLFPNTRNSGNALVGPQCTLPTSISALTQLEHMYMSNDVSMSAMVGTLPDTIGNLANLKCIYLSHNNFTGAIPASVSKLTQLQVFLARMNQLTGTVPDLSSMPGLRNVWFDGNKLTGTLGSLAGLKQLTHLQASNNALSGAMPPNLCNITCEASGALNKFECPLPRDGCCLVTECGDKSPHQPPSPPPVSMGECFPQ